MKNFNLRIFVTSSLLIGLGTFISMMSGWDLSESASKTDLFWYILSKSFYVFIWPLTTIHWLTKWEPSNFSFLVCGIILNCFLNGLIIERIFALRKKTV